MPRLSRLFVPLFCLLSLAACQALSFSPANETATMEAQAAAIQRNTEATVSAIQTATAAVPTATPTITPTPDPFPTPVRGQIYVAEQRFEGGWMFWLQPNTQIWLLTVDDSGQNVWTVYEDTFADGDIESDPLIVAPEGRFQPVRGFGKLWRENLEVRNTIGWAIEGEQGHTTGYEYHHGGHVTEDNTYVPAAGYHLVESIYDDTFRFNEGVFTWEIET